MQLVVACLRAALVYASVPLAIIIQKIVRVLYWMGPRVVHPMLYKAGFVRSEQPDSEALDFIFSTELIRMLTKMKVCEIFKTAAKGKAAPNVELLQLEDQSKPVKLLDLAKKGRPLVLNFGSCT